MKLKRCEQRLHDCFACTPSGCCKLLNNTTFKRFGETYKCPFYKKKTELAYDPDQYGTTEED